MKNLSVILSQVIIGIILIETAITNSSVLPSSSGSSNELINEELKDGKHLHNGDMMAMKSLSKGLSNSGNKLLESRGQMKKLNLTSLVKELETVYENLIIAAYLIRNVNSEISESDIFLKEKYQLNEIPYNKYTMRKRRDVEDQFDQNESSDINESDYIAERNDEIDITSNMEPEPNTKIFEVAYKIKSFLAKIEDEKLNISAEHLVHHLLAKLPACLKTIITEQLVCFRNHMYNEFIYASSKDSRTETYIHDFYVNSNRKKLKGNSEFFVERVVGDVFLITNNKYKQYLSTGFTTRDNEARYVFLSRVKLLAHWQLIIEDHDWCSLKNVLWNEFLYLNDNTDYWFRNAFTYRKKLRAGFQSEWSIEPCQ